MHPQSPRLRALAAKWADVPAGERANYQLFLLDLADALGVSRPQPRGSGYEFEYPLPTATETGKRSKSFVDLYRVDHFVLEAKDRGGDGAGETALRKAYSQAKHYTVDLPHAPPPYLLVLDVGRTLLVWDRWSGTYGGFNLARRFDLRTLADRPDEIDFLRAVWESPASLDPRGRAAAVTREVAARLAELSGALEDRGHDPEQVARFLMRCVFTMFAEDVELLAGKPFQTALSDYRDDPAEFAAVMEDLWKAMDEGRRFGLKRLLRFNGHFFKDASSLPLTRADLAVLFEAAKADWRQVEPTIFGTLLTRALDPKERHRLGAEYTPRAYVERVVRQAVEVPIRERWEPVQAEVIQLVESGRKRDRATAEKRLREFHAWLKSLRFLDPACGSGNFLYVTLHAVKRIELEVLRELWKLVHQAEIGILEKAEGSELGVEEVGPWQFYGIEKSKWAREIAELTLWIGYHQFWMEHHKGSKPEEPVLRDTRTLLRSDAVLAYDKKVEIPEKARVDPTPRVPHLVTGNLVADPGARLPYHDYQGARQAEWPPADFIVGNPPFMGDKRMREVFGDGYVEALRSVYPDVPDSADYVMCWWSKAASAVASGATIRAGLITTNSISQVFNRRVIETAMRKGTRICWAIRNHPWVDEAGSANVRVAMTVLGRECRQAKIVEVDSNGKELREIVAARLNSDLTVHANVAETVALRANSGIAAVGFALHGQGFVLSREEAQYLLKVDFRHSEIVRPFRNGKDITQRPRFIYVIDFGLRSEEEAREYPVLYDIVRSRVKPERDVNRRPSRVRSWWLFGEPTPLLREAVSGLERFFVTPMVAKHRFFVVLDPGVAPDQKLVVIASSEMWHFGVLNSMLHGFWATAAGARIGVGDDPTYNKTRCFDPFPFPDPPKHLRERIALVAEALDQHRKEALARDEKVTMTGMYNVLEKLRSGDALTAKEREVHEIAACGVLRDLHDELDRLVAAAYGWPWPMERDEILERLVALHDERVEEEKQGRVRWLRPEYQVPRFGRGEAAAPAAELALADAETPASAAADERRPWPGSAIEQIAAAKARVAEPATPQQVAAALDGAPVALVERHLDTLVLVGEVRRLDDGRYVAVAEPL